MILSKRENAVMNAVYELCDGTDYCFVSREDILSVMRGRERGDIDDILYALHCDGFFELIPSQRRGEKMYVIALKESGLAFRRARTQRRRDVTFKLALAAAGAVTTFVFGRILRSLFG